MVSSNLFFCSAMIITPDSALLTSGQSVCERPQPPAGSAAGGGGEPKLLE